MIKKEIKAIIFDKDGVLIESEEINMQAAIESFKSLGIKITSSEQKLILGRHPEDFAPIFLKKYDFSYEEFRKIQREAYHRLYTSAKPKKLILSLIKDLEKNRITLALATTSSKNSTIDTLRRLKLLKTFKVITTFDDVSHRKPHPEPYLKILEKLNISNEEAVVIEDSPVGVESAKNAGIKCIVLKTPYVDLEELSKADLISDSLIEIKDYLRSLGVRIC